MMQPNRVMIFQINKELTMMRHGAGKKLQAK
jgi:hypothetical protein